MTQQPSEEIKLHDPNDARRFFEFKNHCPRIRFTFEGLYSASFEHHAKFVAELVLSFYTPGQLLEKRILDASVGMGSNAAEFAKISKHVDAYDINPVHAAISAHNLKELGHFNTTVNHGDFTSALECPERYGAVFMDPPWGGLDYKHLNTSVTFEEGREFHETIADTDLERITDILIVKLPKTYDTKKLETVCAKKWKNVYIVPIRIRVGTGRRCATQYNIFVASNVPKRSPFPTRTFEYMGYKDIRFE